MFTESKYIKR